MRVRNRWTNGGVALPAVAVLAIGLTAGVAALSGQSRQAPPLAPELLVGSESFDLYCASCHGRGARGDGPVGPSLWKAPADLTTLSRRNGGTFPRSRVRDYLDGSTRLTTAHGLSDMPVWGPVLRALEASDARATVRLDNLVAFIESVQVAGVADAATGPDPSGAVLYRTYCAGCHGRDGNGDGVMAGEMRQRPPDVTVLAARNGGTFPGERVRQIIEGRGPAAHGNRDMPLWGALFKYARGGSPDPVNARLDALVDYLAAIQRRSGE